jgi:hypothetical protein
MTTIEGRLDSTAEKTVEIQFFSNPSSTGAEGNTFLSQKRPTTGADGRISFTFSTTRSVGEAVTATTTGPGGNTSGFFAARAVISEEAG